jgi:GNAT superfamily N-acetyltransferase
MATTLTSAIFPQDMALMQQLLREYQDWLGVDLCFQSFEDELEALPVKYAQPTGDMLIARVNGKVAGCISWYPVEQQIAEIKRLYVRPAFRGQGIGRKLFVHAIDKIRDYGYRAVRLDSLERLSEAKKLYESFDFRPISPYNDNPLPDVYYMELSLVPAANN